MVRIYEARGAELGGDAFYEDWVEVVRYEDYTELESKFNDMHDMLVKLDNDLNNGVIPDEYAYNRVGEILEKYCDVISN